MCLAIPGKIVSVSGNDYLSKEGKIDFGGTIKTISLSFVPEAKIGDYVIVHAGLALTLVDEKEALETIKLMKEIGIDEIS
ncbi:MAG: HypC/HybG/HupF family hydrogenase formation chaperone [Candidatus Riflebacteria bacterium]|nr:HypC/HybG/HupF family hydrogenase formation chaperone [Candidatus Riflebacteria bacterium]